MSWASVTCVWNKLALIVHLSVWHPAPTLCVWLEWGLGGGWGLEGAGTWAWAWAGGGMWKKGVSPLSIHTCLPGIECIARPPGSETRAWRTKGRTNYYYLINATWPIYHHFYSKHKGFSVLEISIQLKRMCSVMPAGVSVSVPANMQEGADGVLPCRAFQCLCWGLVAMPGQGVGKTGMLAGLVEGGDRATLNPSPGRQQRRRLWASSLKCYIQI